MGNSGRNSRIGRKIFGKQQIMNEEDICIGTEPNLLINSTELSFDELWDIVTGQYGGVMIPAHIDKNANSLISNLGFVPPESQFRTAGAAPIWQRLRN